MYYYTSSRRIKLSITLKDAKSVGHQGNCTEDIKRLAKKPYIRRQLEKLDREILAEELLEIACCDIREEYS